MTADVVAIRESASYLEIAELLAARKVTAVPVIDATRHVVGVVSEADLLAKVEFATAFPAAVRRADSGAARAKAAGDVARDLMTSPAITVERDMSLAAAARRMADQSVKRLPVVDSSGMLVGIVSRLDLVRGFLRPDDQLRADVLGVLWEWFRVGPAEVNVVVHDGVVTLTGEFEGRRQAILAETLTRGVEGVVDVVVRLTWRVDDSRSVRGTVARAKSG